MEYTAFEHELAHSYPAVFRYARKLTHGDEEAARDLVQATMLRAWEYRAKYIPQGRMIGWLCRILKNTFIDGRTAPRTRTEYTVDDSHWTFLANQHAHQPAQVASIEFKESISKVHDYSPLFAEVLLRHAHGDSHEEMAAYFNCTINTVKTRIHRAKNHLHRIMN